MVLTGKKIIITRALEQTSEAREIFRKNGAEVFDLPSLVIGPPDDWAPLDDALKEITTFDWIIFSSANGVRNVEERMQEIFEQMLNQQSQHDLQIHHLYYIF